MSPVAFQTGRVPASQENRRASTTTRYCTTARERQAQELCEGNIGLGTPYCLSPRIADNIR